MKTIKTERTVSDICYEALDGTRFNNKEECEKYESSAEAVLRGKFKELVVEKGNEYSFFHVGTDDATIYAVRMTKEAQTNTVKQLWEFNHEYLRDTQNYDERQKEAYDKIDTAFLSKDILFVGEDCEGGIYIIATRASILYSLQNIGKKQNENKDDSKG